MDFTADYLDDENVKVPSKPIENNYNWIFYALVIATIIVIVYFIVSRRKSDKHQAHKYFTQLHGDAYDKTAQKAIEHGERNQNKTATDNFELGVAYLVNKKDYNKAHDNFKQALNKVIEGKADIKEAPFIIERIDDYRDFFLEFPDIEDLPVQEAILAHGEEKKRELEKLTLAKEAINAKGKSLDENLPQKIILSQQKWSSESQNVHDNTIYKELNEQYELVKNENNSIPDIQLKTYEELVGHYLVKYKDSNKYKKLNEIFDKLQYNYPSSIIKGNEQDLVVNVWRRSYDSRNKNNADQIREALSDALVDCIEGGNVVCMAGRASKIWQALAHLDFNPKIGIIKGKQAIRNEIYERCAKIVDDYIGEDGSCSDELKKLYLSGDKSPSVSELITTMQNEMDKLKPSYKDLIADDMLELIFTECKSVC